MAIAEVLMGAQRAVPNRIGTWMRAPARSPMFRDVGTGGIPNVGFYSRMMRAAATAPHRMLVEVSPTQGAAYDVQPYVKRVGHEFTPDVQREPAPIEQRLFPQDRIGAGHIAEMFEETLQAFSPEVQSEAKKLVTAIEAAGLSVEIQRLAELLTTQVQSQLPASHKLQAVHAAFDPTEPPWANLMAEVKTGFGRTMSRLPEVFGVSRQTLYNWLSGETPKEVHQARLRELAAAARVLHASGIKPTTPMLDRTVSNGKSLLELLRDGADGQEAAQRLVRLVKRSAGARSELATLLAGRTAAPPEASEFGTRAFREDF